MKSVRRWFVAAACVLGLLTVTGVAQAQSTKLLPPDTELVFTVNLQQIIKSDAVKANKELFDLAKAKINEGLDGQEAGKWLKKAEFDIFKDLDSVTFAIPGARNPEEAFIVVEGNFDADKIEAAALEANKEAKVLKVIELAGVKAFEITKNEKTFYIGILNSKTIIGCATKDDFKGAVARSKSTKKNVFKSEVFNSLMQTVNSKQSISMVATSTALLKLADKAPEGAPIEKAVDELKKLDGFSASISIQKNIDFTLGVNAKDADTASDYATKGNVGLGLAKLKIMNELKNEPKLQHALDVLNTIKISSKGPNLLVSGQISFETLDKLLKLIPMQQ